ncbi:uncharacterized protein HaLaN_17599 [Haematococcus lacustris]|uniref:SCP domain-containing protein n=1 Tax=Haematococcus lacustris TaxID=44745 RepID=A0A699ZX03_HAELA|nr:uncharacterized protein HaLaN_17599 [Haematococcus lacustris]
MFQAKTLRLVTTPGAKLYNEQRLYNYDDPGFSMSVGHFTQMVWVGSSRLDWATATSKRGRTYYVCRYAPPGNYKNDFVANVLPPAPTPRAAGAARPTDSPITTRIPLFSCSDTSPITALGNDVLALHTAYRAVDLAPPMSYDPKLEEAAQRWANHLASSGTLSCEPAVTGVVWRSSTKVGWATAPCPYTSCLVYVLYYSPDGYTSSPEAFKGNVWPAVQAAAP